MPKPITYKSPKLIRLSHDLLGDLRDAETRCRFVCIGHLTRLLKLEELPEASEYQIEMSTEQWDDEGGCEIWVCKRSDWLWGSTQEYQGRAFFHAVLDALDNSGIAEDEPVRIYFRLTYNE